MSKKVKTEADLSVPLNLDNFKIDPEDCFGNEWKPDSTECSSCHDIDICGILYSVNKVSPKTKKVKEELGKHFLDEVNFQRIDKSKLIDLIKNKKGEMTSKDFITYVKHYSRCEDHDTIILWIKEFKTEFSNVKVKGGKVSYE